MMVIITLLYVPTHGHKTEKHDHNLVPNIAHYVILSNFLHTNNNHGNEKMGNKRRMRQMWEKRCAMVAKRVLALRTGTTSFSCAGGCNENRSLNTYQQQPQPQLIPANMVNRVIQQLTYSLVVHNNKRHLKNK